MLDRQLCIEITKQLKYVYGQAPGDKLKASVKDNEAVRLYLPAGAIRQIALLIKEIERVEQYQGKKG